MRSPGSTRSLCRLAPGGPTAPAGLDTAQGFLDLVDELSAEFVTDPPCQPALAGVACRQDDGELRGNVGIFGDDLHAAVRHVRNGAVTRQRAGPELDLRDPSADLTFAPSSIRQHIDPLASLVGSLRTQVGLQKNRWNLPSRTARNVSVVFEFFLPSWSEMSRNGATSF